MTMETDYITALVKTPEYLITSFVIGIDEIMLFVSDTVPKQNEIPKTLFGKNVLIRKSL